MSSVDPLGSSTSATSRPASAADQLGQKDFLKLMMTQFSNQDPFKPMDATQFLGQLAQFSTVNGINGMQGSLATLVDSFKSDQMLSGAMLVGREVLVPTTTVALPASGTVNGAVDVPEGTQQVVIGIKDSAGQLVRQFSVAADAGTNEFAWDGNLQDGTRATAGPYTVEALGITAGKNSSLQVLVSDKVGSVTLDPTTSNLVLNTATQGTVPLAAVRRIS
jgi:flagellar basal-body rod modification protein FlgD